MDVDDVNDPLGLPPDNSAAKIEELPDDTLIEPVITSKTNAYVIDSSIENTDAEIVNDSMEDIETSLPVRLESRMYTYSQCKSYLNSCFR